MATYVTARIRNRNLLLLGGFFAAPAAGLIALASLAPTAQAPATLQSACVEAVTAKERGNYPDYWVINSDMLTAGKARVFYGVARLERETAHLINNGNRMEDQLIATCTGTPESPVVELVSVNAMDAASAPSGVDLQQQIEQMQRDGLIAAE